MPVHADLSGSVLAIAVDGDYTRDELQRVTATALAAAGTPSPTRVLLDLSGAASLAARTDEELAATAAFFAHQGELIDRVAVLVRGDILEDLMRMGTAFAVQKGLKASPFRDRDEAVRWLTDPE